MDYLHHLMETIVESSILMFEFIGVAVLVAAGIMGAINYVRKNPCTRLQLAKGMAMGLEFKLGSEILRTVIAQDFNEILIVGGIIALRASLTLLIHWEIKNEERHV
mgnify:CR=1 FL=1